MTADTREVATTTGCSCPAAEVVTVVVVIEAMIAVEIDSEAVYEEAGDGPDLPVVIARSAIKSRHRSELPLRGLS